VLQVCESLMEAMKATGVEFDGKFREPAGREDGVDACAQLAGGGVVEVQVVGVRDQTLSRMLGAKGTASSTKAADEMADDICDRVVKKRDSYPSAVRQGRVLAVDAIRSPGHTTPAVLKALQQPARAEVLRSSGFEAVWIVGPTQKLTFRVER